MPWCDPCDKYLTPNGLADDGTCPTCHSDVDTQDMAKAATAPTKAPWHFWLMVISLVAYLGWRLLQGGIWLIDQV